MIKNNPFPKIYTELKCLWKKIKEIEQSPPGSGIQSIVPGDNISVDNTDPQNPVVSSTGEEVTWDSITDKPAVIASGTTQAAARQSIGAGTGNSNLVIGTTATTAKAGNYTPSATEVVNALNTVTPEQLEDLKDTIGDNLLFEYVHSGNKEVYIDSIDYETNTFTSVGHGFVEDEIVSCLPSFDKINSWTQDLMLLLPFSNASHSRDLRIINVTPNTFQVSQDGELIALTQKETVANDSFKFEARTTTTLQFNNINQNNIRIVCTGFNANNAWFSLNTNDGTNSANELGGRPNNIFFNTMPHFMSVETKIQYKNGLYNKVVSEGNHVGINGNGSINSNVVWKNTGSNLERVTFVGRFNYNGFIVQIFKL